MRITFVCYEHSCVGFPHIKLKWAEEGTGWLPPYITKHGVITSSGWRFTETQQKHALNREHECARFDDWVRKTFADDPTVQG